MVGRERDGRKGGGDLRPTLHQPSLPWLHAPRVEAELGKRLGDARVLQGFALLGLGAVVLVGGRARRGGARVTVVVLGFGWVVFHHEDDPALQVLRANLVVVDVLELALDWENGEYYDIVQSVWRGISLPSLSPQILFIVSTSSFWWSSGTWHSKLTMTGQSFSLTWSPITSQTPWNATPLLSV